MMRVIERFDLDAYGNWRAKLKCGDYQHARHEPPLRSREWILREDGRALRIEFEVERRKCDESRPSDF